MKTTIDIHDELLERAKRYAKKTGRTLRSVIEDGLRHEISKTKSKKPYKLNPNLRTGKPGGPNPLEGLSWPELRALIYGDKL